MIVWLSILLLMPQTVWADVFLRSSDQTELNQRLSKDVRNTYYRGSYDYNAFDESKPSYRLERNHISLGCNRYDYHESLKNLFTRSEFSAIELETLMNQLSTSRFLVWQYSSPTLADLYKHLDTMGNLRLGLRYHQCEDLENTVQDPIVKLRKQAIMDCLKRKEGSGDLGDIDLVFKECFDGLSESGTLASPYESLEDPGNGAFYISGSVNVTEKTLDRVNKTGEDLSTVKEIIPTIFITNDSVDIRSPNQSSRELIAEYRNDFLSELSAVVRSYKESKQIETASLETLSVFGVPLTEGQVKNISLLDDTSSYLAMNKIASELAYLKAIDQYSLASQMLDRVMSHPAIQPGYKTLLKSDTEYVQKEMNTLKEEKGRLQEYAQSMSYILDEADRQRMQILSRMKEEANSKQGEGIFKLNL